MRIRRLLEMLREDREKDRVVVRPGQPGLALTRQVVQDHIRALKSGKYTVVVFEGWTLDRQRVLFRIEYQNKMFNVYMSGSLNWTLLTNLMHPTSFSYKRIGD